MAILFALLVFGLFGVFTLAATTSATAQVADNPINDSEETPDEQDGRQIESTLGQLEIINVEYDSETMTGDITVRWTGRAPERTTFTQIDPEAGKAAIETIRLRPDEETTISVDLVSDKHGLLYTEESMSNQRAEVIKFEETTERETSLLRGLIYGGSVVLLATIAMAWRKINTFEKPQRGFDK